MKMLFRESITKIENNLISIARERLNKLWYIHNFVKHEASEMFSKNIDSLENSYILLLLRIKKQGMNGRYICKYKCDIIRQICINREKRFKGSK